MLFLLTASLNSLSTILMSFSTWSGAEISPPLLLADAMSIIRFVMHYNSMPLNCGTRGGNPCHQYNKQHSMNIVMLLVDILVCLVDFKCSVLQRAKATLPYSSNIAKLILFRGDGLWLNRRRSIPHNMKLLRMIKQVGSKVWFKDKLGLKPVNCVVMLSDLCSATQAKALTLVSCTGLLS